MLLVTHADIPFSVIIFNDFLFCGWLRRRQQRSSSEAFPLFPAPFLCMKMMDIYERELSQIWSNMLVKG